MDRRPVLAVLAVTASFSCQSADERAVEPEAPAMGVELVLDDTQVRQPIFVTAPEGDERLWIVEQRGRVLLLKPDGSLPMFLDLRSKIIGWNLWHGLGSLVFHPDYNTNGYFFVVYTNGATKEVVLSRFSVSADPDVADAGSEVEYFKWVFPDSSAHDRCDADFNPLNGYLYVSFGDGTSGPPSDSEVAQDLANPRGKILRIDVDTPDGIRGTPYSIPPGNPFVSTGGARPEIWATGFRNPWRMAFDPVTGDLFIGDVGYEAWEEVNVEPAGSPGGRHYGWNYLEGTDCGPRYPGCNRDSLVAALTPVEPVFAYGHNSNGPRCSGSVIGGGVYRGTRLPRLRGRYIFADFCHGRMWSLDAESPVGSVEEITELLSLPDGAGFGPAGIGFDGAGEIYIADQYRHHVYRVVVEDM